MTGDLREQLRQALDSAERIALEASRDGDEATPTGEHWQWECSNCDTPVPVTDVTVLDEFMECPACGSFGIDLRSVERYPSQYELPHLVTHSCEEIRPVDALHIASWGPATALRLIERDRALLAAHESAVEFYDRPANRFLSAGEVHGLWLAIELAAEFWLGTPEQEGSAPK